MIDRKWPLYFEIIDSWSSPFHAYREKICKPVRTVKKKNSTIHTRLKNISSVEIIVPKIFSR